MTKAEAKDLAEHLYEKGYRRFFQNWKNEDYSYHKGFAHTGEGDDRKAGYQCAVLFYDKDKWKHLDPSAAGTVGIQFEALFNIPGTDRFDVSIYCEGYTIEQFETEMEELYRFLSIPRKAKEGK